METLALSKDQHAQSLERLCVSALSSGDAATAFMLADRRCRILPPADAHHFALRAEALIRLGHHDQALSDILEALTLSPADIQANRRLLSWGDDAQKLAAARVLVASDDDAAALAQALVVLGEQGGAAVGAARLTDDTVSGWAAWNGPIAPSLRVTDHESEASLILDADPCHPLAGGSFDHVAGFHVRRTLSPTGHLVRLTLSNVEFFRTRGAANARTRETANNANAPGLDTTAEVTVIVPVYRDYGATRACLESLEEAIAGNTGYRVLLVNDATPEPRLEEHLHTFATKSGFVVLTNDSNLGFVGSINRAIRMIGSGDVVLLNADTIVPRGFLARMTSIARSDPTIGTITPLSNNGEFTSFPIPFEQNHLPARAEVDAIDALAARVNRGEVIDLPNGIGFCLYITGACLDQVGLLSPSFQRGYLEDVDFCLRARERGFRNVCAASIYVGHAGSRSFGSDKRALVVRNVAVVESRFPDYRQECALFMKADPLRRARQAIERELALGRFECLLICGEGALVRVAEARASRMREDGKSVLLLRVGSETLSLRASGGEVPQSLTFEARLAGVADLFDYLQAVCLGSVEIFEPAMVSDALMKMLQKLGRPVRVVAADAGLVCPRGTLVQADGRVCSTLGTDDICESCLAACGRGTMSRAQWQDRWARLDVESVPASGRCASGFAAFIASGAGIPRRVSALDSAVPARSSAKRTGIVVQSSTVDEFRLVQQFLRGAQQFRPDQTYVIVGETADDLALMAVGNAFVAGAVDAGRCPAVFDQYRLGKLILPLRRALYGHPLAEAAEESGLPRAYFDWSFGLTVPREGDLAIDPRNSVDQLVALLGQWVEA